MLEKENFSQNLTKMVGFKYQCERIIKLRYHYLLLTLTFLFFIQNQIFSQGQEVFSRIIDTEKGAPSEQFFDLALHPDHSILLASDRGLYKFNGILHKKIPFKNHRSNSLTDIFIASDGAIWCRNFSEQVFRGDENKMEELKLLTDLISGENCVGIHQLNNQVFLVTNFGVYSSSLTGKENKRILKHDHIETSFVWNNALFIADIHGNLMLLKNNELKKIAKTPFKKARFAVWKNQVFIFSREQSQQQVFRLEKKEFKPFTFLPISEPFLVLNTIVEKDFFGVATTQGLVIIKANGKTEWLEKGKRVTDLCRDKENNYWLSSLDNGLILIPDFTIRYVLKSENGENFNNLTIGKNNQLFISTNRGGIIQYNYKTGNKTAISIPIEQNLEFISIDTTTELLYFSSGSFNLKTNQFIPFYFGKDISFDSRNRIYFALHSLAGFLSKSEETNLFSSIPLSKISFQNATLYSIRKQRTRTIQYLKNESLLIGFADQLIHYSKAGKKVWLDEYKKPIYATDIIENDIGVWVSTTQNGLFLFKHTGEIIKHWKVNDGITGEICKKLFFNKNILYVVHDKGVDIIHNKTRKAHNITADFGIQHLIFNDIVIIEDSIFFLTNKGLLRAPVYREYEKDRQTLSLTSWIVNGKKRNLTHFNLKNTQNSIRFNWNLTVFKKANTESLEYRLLPKMKKWNSLSTQSNAIDFFDLQAGSYRFELRFKTNPTVKIHHCFVIDKPYWLTWWFLSLAIILFFTSFYFIFQYAQNRFRKQQLFKERLVFSQLTALRSQMNPHFLYNVLNSLQGLIYSKKINEAGDYVSKFSDHLRRVLDFSSKQEITLKQEIEGLQLYLELEKLRFGEDFQFEILKKNEIDESTMIPTMIIQPFVENAVKHGLMNKQGEKIVKILFELSEANTLKIEIIDNGIGRKAAEIINAKRKDKPSSFALSAIEGRINLLSNYYKKPIVFKAEDILQESSVAGTKITLLIPPKKDE